MHVYLLLVYTIVDMDKKITDKSVCKAVNLEWICKAVYVDIHFLHRYEENWFFTTIKIEMNLILEKLL